MYHWYHELERQRIRGFGTFSLASTDPSYREATMLSLHFKKSTEVKATGQPGQPGQRGQRANARTSWHRQMVDTMDINGHHDTFDTGRLGQGGIAFATAFVARASAGNLWLRMASCFDASSMLHAASGFIWFHLVSKFPTRCQVVLRAAKRERHSFVCSKEERDSAAQWWMAPVHTVLPIVLLLLSYAC